MLGKKIWGKKFVGKKCWGKNEGGKILGKKFGEGEGKLGGQKNFGEKCGVYRMIYDAIASSIFAPREPSSKISESFIVIGSAVFEKPAINVSVRIIITRPIYGHKCLGFPVVINFSVLECRHPWQTNRLKFCYQVIGYWSIRQHGLKLSQMWVANFPFSVSSWDGFVPKLAVNVAEKK